MREILKLEFYNNPEMQQILSNGKPYYTPSRAYVLPSYFYVDDNNNVVAIAVSVYYAVGYTKYGLFGDEGRGFSLSRKDIKDIGGDNKIYLEK